MHKQNIFITLKFILHIDLIVSSFYTPTQHYIQIYYIYVYTKLYIMHDFLIAFPLLADPLMKPLPLKSNHGTLVGLNVTMILCLV